ncbi:mRNA 3'-end-processing protein rna14 [Coemansia sp. RSA 990]|nr:hypothetical protein BX667DRAFT_496724 [Coemansia mojavensis]KAJ1873175.1 mRNA 3'-end-processing protein rna14 [Coemansia sp. RSA 990]
METEAMAEPVGLLENKQSTGYPEVDELKRRLLRSPTDADTWSSLFELVRSLHNEQLLHATFVSVLEKYPGSGHLLAGLVELELSRGNKSSAEVIFNNNLFNVPSVELWQSYLQYVRDNNGQGDGSMESRSTIIDCFKLVLDNVGVDREAGQIWIDYIEFINSAQTHAPYEEQQKTELLRETYQAAVSIPLLKVEEIWKSYDAFENSVDRMGAKQQMSKVSPSYMTARTALREMNRIWDQIKSTQGPHGLPQPPQWSLREVEHLDAWKRCLKWELDNPLRLNEHELQKRVIYTYGQMCMDLWLYPEVWIEFAEYYASIGQQNEALTKLLTASSVLPNSLAVQFAYAEAAEKMKQLETSKQVYETVIATQRTHIEEINAKYSRKLSKLDKKLEKASSKQPAHNEQDSSDSDVDNIGMPQDDASMASDSDTNDGAAFGEDARAKQAEKQAMQLRKAVEQRKDALKQQQSDELADKCEMYTLAWVMYLRYMQRSEGIDAVRQLLKRSRSEPAGYMTHHFYVAAALMEYHVGKRPNVASKLLEHYSKNFSEVPEYIYEYMSYLINSGDDTNARALFERFHSTAAGDTTDMWSMFADFEYNYGDLGAIDKLDRRFIEKFNNESVLTRMATRYSYLNVNCVAVNEFGFPYRKDMQLHSGRNAGQSHNVGSMYEDMAGMDVDAQDYLPSGSDTVPNVGVASVTGRYLDKNQLLAPVMPGRFARPALNMLQEYNPVVEPFVPPESPMTAGSGSMDHRNGPTAFLPSPQFRSLLDQGDVLSYVAACVAAPDTSAFDSQPINPDALLNAIMQFNPGSPTMPSNYRPLCYMPWASRPDHPHQPYSAGNAGYYRNERGGGRSYSSRSQSRGRYSDNEGYRGRYHGNDGHRGGYGHSPRHNLHGVPPHRQPPYSRNPGYPADNRPPYRGHGPRFNARSGYRGRP